MTPIELAQLAALKECSFSPGSTAKAFIRKLREMKPSDDLSDKQAAFLDNLAHQYRRQIGRCMSEACMKCEDQVTIGYGTASGRTEHCQKCHQSFDVDEQGRVPQHRKRTGAHFNGGQVSSSIAPTLCSRSGHPSDEEMKRRKEARATDAAMRIGHPDFAVALDALIEGLEGRVSAQEVFNCEFKPRLPAWRKAALRFYNKQHGESFARPYEYATKVKPSNRRAETRGDVYCRFCGERLFAQIKEPHKLVAESTEAMRHLMICALQILAGMREPAKPGHRAMPMESMWRDDERPAPKRGDDGPLFGGGS